MRDRSRVRWIKVLILILALTASRANFPLRTASAATVRQPSQLVALSAKSKKGEAVIPSRRMAETRRSDWVRTLACETHLSPSLKHLLAAGSDDERFTVQDLPRSEISPESTAPDYLRACSRAPDTHALPPPL
jgi:hypothetical protein